MGMKKYCQDIPSGLLNFYRLSFMSISLFIIMSIFWEIPILSLDVFFWAAVSALTGSVAAMGTYMHSHKYLPISILNAFFAIVPVFVAIVSYFIFDEKLSYLEVTGGIITIIGVLLLIRYRKYQPKHERDGVI
jgi:drug/metabolite transporter (DMT)-like permease